MPLTDIAIRKAKPAEKPVRLADEKGLYLEIAPGGGKWWRLKYRFGGKEKRLSLGVHPNPLHLPGQDELGGESGAEVLLIAALPAIRGQRLLPQVPVIADVPDFGHVLS